MRDDTTLTAEGAARGEPGDTVRAGPALTVVHHRDPSLLGRRCFPEPSVEHVLGRGCALFEEAVLDDARVSRRHASLLLGPGGAPDLRDLGSRNGTTVNGQPFARGSLSRGDVIGLGDVLLLFHDAPRTVRSPPVTPMIAASAAMLRVLDLIERVAGSDRTVLVQGPTGVGKELVAREIHAKSGRKGQFVAVNCGAVADSLLQSELFGHARGSFSGASAEREGLVEAARDGTLFLDEIGDASPALQVALLRLLEQREYRRLGQDALRTTSARFLAATHVSLASAGESGRFRADLLGRIARWIIDVPALAERPDDIVPLALAFARRLAGEGARLSAPLTLALLRCPWPMNVRELSAVIDQAALERTGDGELSLSAGLARRLAPRPSRPEGGSATAPASAPRRPGDHGRGRAPGPAPATDLADVLRRAGGNMRAAAVELGVARSTLYRWIEESNIDLEELRAKVKSPRDPGIR